MDIPTHKHTNVTWLHCAISCPTTASEVLVLWYYTCDLAWPDSCLYLWFHADTGATAITAAHSATVNLTCIDPVGRNFPPAWIMDGLATFPNDGYWSYRNETTGELIGILAINGNRTCGTFNVYCLPNNGQIIHNTTLTVEG